MNLEHSISSSTSTILSRRTFLTGLLSIGAATLTSACYSMETSLIPTPSGLPPRITSTPAPIASTRTNEQQVAVATLLLQARQTATPGVINSEKSTATPVISEPAEILIAPTPQVSDYLNYLNQIKNPIYRAAACIVAGRKENANMLGHTSIFIDDNQRLFMATIGHVVKDTNEGEFVFLIPGIGKWEVPKIKWQIGPKKRQDDDPPAFYLLDQSPNLLTAITDRVNRQEITPLKATWPVNISNLSASTVMSDRGEWADLTFDRYTEDNWLLFLMKKGRVCNGFSGQSILIKENGSITNKSCGLLMGVSQAEPGSCMTKTTDEIYIRPHN